MAFSKNRRLAQIISDVNGNISVQGITVPTQSSSDNDTSAASTAFVHAHIDAVLDSAPGTLNTLNEIAAALNDDANFNTTVTNAIAAKLPLAGGTMTGALNMGSQNITGANRLTLADGITDTGQAGSATVFNESGSTADFRIESDSNAHMFFLDAGQNSVGINQSQPSSSYVLDVGGQIRSSGNAPGFNLREDDSSNQHWQLGSFGGVFAVRNVTGSSYPLQINGGNVGINTGAPQSVLAVRKSLAAGNADLRVIDLVIPGSWSNSGNAGHTADITWTNAEAAGYVMGKFGLRYAGTATGGNSEFVFKDMYQGSYGASADIMYLGSNGYVGIPGRVGVGTSTPATGLHIQGGDNTEAKLTLTNTAPSPDNTWSLHPVYNNQNLILAEDGTARVTFEEGGNVKFGQSIEITNSNAAEISLTGSGSGNIVAANDLYIMAGSGTSAGNLYIGSDGTNAQVILDGGQLTTQGITAVGGGNYSTGTVGLISKSVSNRGTVRVRSDGDNPAELFFDVNGGISWDFSSRGSASSYDMLIYPRHGTPALDAVAAHKFRFTQSGHLGIGSSTHARAGLDVSGAIMMTNSDYDLGTHSYSTYANRVNHGAIRVQGGYSGTLGVGRKFTFKYDATSWKAFHGVLVVAATGGHSRFSFGGYWNNSGSCSFGTVENNLNMTPSFITSGQSVRFDLTLGQAMTHPVFYVEYHQSGGDGEARMDRAEMFIL